MGLTTVLVTLDTALDVRRENAIFWQHFRQHSALLADTLNEVLREPLYLVDVDQVGDIAELVASQPGITYVQVYSPQGRLIKAETAPDAETFSANDDLLTAAVQNRQVMYQEGIHQLDVATPIMVGDDIIGVVRVGFDVKSLSQSTNAILLENATQGLGLLAVGALLSYLLARYAIRPRRTLTAAAKEIGAGQLDTAVQIGGTQEVALLGNALEGMRSELRVLYQDLEQQVEIRTQELQASIEQMAVVD